ncbi:uncharacterized protein LOC131691289 [Topomyia yanbarensis]|uniref:uncharacterized protein LOC131691289 n=1 Tax=Topomyia yanbarensis TaxID=2498891 RepID=UPI00273C8264|nr:uncharacterized protein LOC131691289 [Topomyia yanbarensis]
MWNLSIVLLLVLSQVEQYVTRMVIESSTVEFDSFLEEQSTKTGECKISLKKALNLKQPLYLIPGTDKFYIPTPNTTDLLFRQGEQVELFCTRGFADTEEKSIITSCDGKNGFVHNDEAHDISQITCKGPLFHVALRTEDRCFNNATLVKVGFEMEPRFLKMYDVCFDENTLVPYFVKHSLSPWNVKHQPTKRPPFIQGDFYPGLKMSKLYSFESQRKNLEKILGSSDRVDAVLDKKKDLFLARGHLAAKADFVFSPHQRATFWFMNVAPQWQKFNGFNWQRIETGVKDFIAHRKTPVTVYTGTYGVLELPDANGDMQKIYMDVDPDNGGRVPVPKVYYKILHDETNDAGIALIGVNNPHATMEEIKNDYIFCNDVSDRINWLKWKRHYIPGGYSYACDVNEFNNVTKHLQLGKISNLLV